MERRLWSEEEDEALRVLVKEHGAQKWTCVAQLMQVRFAGFDRNGKQCRQRWFNHLEDSLMKDCWSVEEQEEFIRLHSCHGNHWSEIAKLMPGRAENAVKNYFYSSVRRALRIINKAGEDRGKSFLLKISFINRVISLLNQPAAPLRREAKLLINSALRMAVRKPKSDFFEAESQLLCEQIFELCKILKTRRRENFRRPETEAKPDRFSYLRQMFREGVTLLSDSSFKVCARRREPDQKQGTAGIQTQVLLNQGSFEITQS